MEQIYKNLTGIDISEQKQIWDERAKGYYGEYLVFCDLFINVTGHAKFLMNLEIPTDFGKKTEIDLLMLHETGIYIFEIKNYKGKIYGHSKDRSWTQFFSTIPNKKFNNPIYQNDYHISAMKRIFPNAPLHSMIVFTNENCSLSVTNFHPNTIVCCLRDLNWYLKAYSSQKKKVYDIDKIDSMFRALLPYSPVSQKQVLHDGIPMPFYDYLDLIKINFDQKNEEVKADFERKKIQLKQTKRKSIIISIAVIIVCILISIFFCIGIKEESNKAVNIAQNQLEKMQQKFMHIDELNNGNVDFVNNLNEVSNVYLKPSKDISNTTVFTCRITGTGEEYGIRLTQNTKYIVMTKDGNVMEYDFFNNLNNYTPLYRIGKGHYSYKDIKSEFYNVKASDITYIKLINIAVWKSGDFLLNDLIDNLELELYSAE